MFWRLFLSYVLLTYLTATFLVAILVAQHGDFLVPEVGIDLVMTGVISVALAVMPAWVFTRRVAGPLRELIIGARKIAEGQYGHKIPPLSAGDRDVRTLCHTFNGMSEQLAAQFDQLDSDRRQMVAVLRGMIEGVIAVGGDGEVVFANERAARLLDFDPVRAVGQKFSSVVRHPPITKLYAKSLETGEAVREEMDHVGPGMKSLAVYAATLPESPAGASGAVLVLHDISELRRLEKLRQEFVSNVSHELKTPLSVIMAGVEALKDGAAEEPGPREMFLDQVWESSERLYGLVLDLLRLGRVDSGEQLIDFHPVPIAVAVADCIDRLYQKAESRSVSLVANPPAELLEVGLTVWADVEPLSTILENLTDNGIKYTPPGGTVDLTWTADANYLHLKIRDTGIGIPGAELPRIFERFYRVNKARSRDMGGTGLGLSIAKQYVELLNGMISVTSRPNEGTEFTVSLPRARDV